jgi:hypothetical protein
MCPPDSPRITGYAEPILTSELDDWIVSQLPTIRQLEFLDGHVRGLMNSGYSILTSDSFIRLRSVPY